MTLLFHGPSGCGKDTQVELLVRDYGFENIGTGEMIRRMYAEGDEDALVAMDEYASKGLFVPNDIIYNKMFPKWLEKFDSEKNWAFVSVVREVGQIKLLDDLLRSKNRVLDLFVHFALSPEAAIERMATRTYCAKCGPTYHPKYKKEKVSGVCDRCGGVLTQREDDKPEKIRKRLEEYNRTINPILEEYAGRGILVEVDASPSIEVIHQEILRVLNL